MLFIIFRSKCHRTDLLVKWMERFLEPFGGSPSLTVPSALYPFLTGIILALQMLPSHCSLCGWQYFSLDLLLMEFTRHLAFWWLTLFDSDVMGQGDPSSHNNNVSAFPVSANPFAEFEWRGDQCLFHLLRWKELTCWSLKHRLGCTEWLEAKSYYPSVCPGGISPCLWLCFLLCPQLPETPSAGQKKKD